MKYLSVPAMFSNSYIEQLYELNLKSKNTFIYETYGSIPNYLLGSIRPGNSLKQITEKDLLDYIKKSKEFGIEFNYIMNSTVINDFEFNEKVKKEMVSFINKLINAGLKRITLSIPYLIKFIRVNFPNLHIVASICMNISSVSELNSIIEMGANSFVIPKDLNRNFRLLKKFVKNKKNLTLKLLCTTPCLYKCSDLNYHMNISAYQDSVKNNNNSVPEAAINCQLKRFSYPVEFLKSPWIRPEDLKIYDSIGISYFKLDGRDKPEKYILEVIKAYFNEFFEGNLLYLFQGSYPKTEEDFYNLIGENTFKIGVFIDNKKLEKFIDGFLYEKLNCDDGCQNCNYCENWKDKVLKINEDFISFYSTYLKKQLEKKIKVISL